MKALVESLIKESKDFDVMLSTVEFLSEYSEPEVIEQASNIYYLRFKMNSAILSSFIEDNLQRITNQKPLLKTFMPEVRKRINKGFIKEVSNQAYIEIVTKNPEIVNFPTLKGLVEIRKNSFLQQRMKVIFINYIQLYAVKEKEQFKHFRDLII